MRSKYRVKSVEERFQLRYEVVGECWIWKPLKRGAKIKEPAFFVDGRNWIARRWILGIDDNRVITAVCRNSLCVNPDHLIVSSREEINRIINPKKERQKLYKNQWTHKIGPPNPRFLWIEQNFFLFLFSLLVKERAKIRSKKTYKKKMTPARKLLRKARNIKRRAAGKVKGKDIQWLLKAQKGLCVVCRAKMSSYHVDHILPVAMGGSSDKGNLQLLCPTCNQDKSAKHPVSFMQERGFLL